MQVHSVLSVYFYHSEEYPNCWDESKNIALGYHRIGAPDKLVCGSVVILTVVASPSTPSPERSAHPKVKGDEWTTYLSLATLKALHLHFQYEK